MWGHLQWHGALAELALGGVARLLGPVLDYLPRGAPYTGLPDTASLLWRLGLRGAAALPWQAAQAHAERHFAMGSNVFGELIKQLKAEGVGIFLISHDMPDVFGLSDRLAVMKNGKLVGTYRTADVTEDEVLGMIILGKRPEGKVQQERRDG
jgi:hypothetical protein